MEQPSFESREQEQETQKALYSGWIKELEAHENHYDEVLVKDRWNNHINDPYQPMTIQEFIGRLKRNENSYVSWYYRISPVKRQESK